MFRVDFRSSPYAESSSSLDRGNLAADPDEMWQTACNLDWRLDPATSTSLRDLRWKSSNKHGPILKQGFPACCNTKTILFLKKAWLKGPVRSTGNVELADSADNNHCSGTKTACLRTLFAFFRHTFRSSYVFHKGQWVVRSLRTTETNISDNRSSSRMK